MGFLANFFPGLRKNNVESSSVESVDVAEVTKVVANQPLAFSYEKLRKQGSRFLDLGKREDAVLAFQAAFQISPCGEAHLNLGFALLEANRVSEAKQHLSQAARLNPMSFDAHLLLANVAVAEAIDDVAIGELQLALAIDPKSEVAANLLNNLFATRGDFEKIENRVTKLHAHDKTPAQIQVALADVLIDIRSDGELQLTLQARAEECLQRAIELNPQEKHAFNAHGQILLSRGEVLQALQAFKSALAIDDFCAPTHVGLAQVHKALGDGSLWVMHAKAAVAADPAYIAARMILAKICTENSEYQQAIGHYETVLEIEPDSPDVFILLGCVYADTKQHDLAVEMTRKAVNLRKDSPDVHFALGNIFASQSRFSEAIDCYSQALVLNPAYLDAKDNLASKLLLVGRSAEAWEHFAAILNIDPARSNTLQNVAFSLSYQEGCTPEAYLAGAKRFGAVCSANATVYTSWQQEPLYGRVLKVGLVSGDLRGHPVGLFLESVLTYLDVEKTEVHAFSNMASTDELQASLKSRVSHWTSIANLTDEAAAKLIHEAELDLLIDLSGHTGAGRVALFAWRPAPVQATWLGFWASTGLAEIDYILTDRHAVLPEHFHHFSEQVWYLADARMCYTPPSAVYEVKPIACPIVKRGHVTFGCFQSIRKINKSVLAVWARIHQQLPQAKFRLQGGGLGDSRICTDLLKRFADAGIPAACVSLHASVPSLEYLKTHEEVDIILDTFPYPGGTTTCDALWMGVPTITLAGSTMLSRQGASLLMYAGLPDWVAQTEDEYVAIAIKKAKDGKQLTLLRTSLRQQVFKSPLFDAPGFASNLENSFRAMVLHKRPELGTTQNDGT